MIIRQFLHQEPVGISYLFGCGGRAAGAVVDPVGDIEPYMRAAEATGMRIHFVIDTHVHADHLSAGRQLAEASDRRRIVIRDGDLPRAGDQRGETHTKKEASHQDDGREPHKNGTRFCHGSGVSPPVR